MVTRFQQRVEQEEDALFGSKHERVVRAQVGEKLDDFIPQQRVTKGLGITQVQIPPHLLHLMICHRQQVSHRHGLAVRAGEQVACGEFIFGKIAFQVERLNVHSNFPW